MAEFKKGDRVEAGDDANSLRPGTFKMFDSGSNYPYIVRQDRFGAGAAQGYAYCRHLRPDLKPGQPIEVVRHTGATSLMYFIGWNEGNVMANRCWPPDPNTTSTWLSYRLLKNYDYSAPVEEI